MDIISLYKYSFELGNKYFKTYILGYLLPYIIYYVVILAFLFGFFLLIFMSFSAYPNNPSIVSGSNLILLFGLILSIIIFIFIIAYLYGLFTKYLTIKDLHDNQLSINNSFINNVTTVFKNFLKPFIADTIIAFIFTTISTIFLLIPIAIFGIIFNLIIQQSVKIENIASYLILLVVSVILFFISYFCIWFLYIVYNFIACGTSYEIFANKNTIFYSIKKSLSVAFNNKSLLLRVSLLLIFLYISIMILLFSLSVALNFIPIMGLLIYIFISIISASYPLYFLNILCTQLYIETEQKQRGLTQQQ